MNCTVIRSARKTLALEVTREGEVIVRSPSRCTDSEISRFVRSHADWLKNALERQQARQENHPEPDAMRQRELIDEAKRVLPEKVAYWAQRMGVQPTGLRITGARTRFGSCSGKNSLCFSWRLMDYPEEAVDYVVVHELAHILEKNHSPRFYAVVARHLPDYRRREKMLRG
ncbi:MAG: M48 family metallopeptidase [Candidatus Heteroscillospira sp.]|jgi:predicted metal-dependent hydrolase